MTTRVRITQIDGALPNLALMRLAAFHKSAGHEVHVMRHIEPDLFEPEYDQVYASAIFNFSAERVERFKRCWPKAIIGGTGVIGGPPLESIVGDFEGVDYAGWPDFEASIGFTQRGCRLKCGFCVVPKKEGKNRSVSTIADIWRGAPHPKKIHLLDNDFFGQPRADWQARIEEIREGGFKVCLSQGINVRLIDSESAAALATIQYRDTKFKERRLYTAWDNLKDEKVFFRGVDMLEAAGIPPRHLMAYMLVGYDPLENWSRIWHRFNRMVERGIHPYPMVYNRARKDLLAWQRWVITGLYRIVPWTEYQRSTKSPESEAAYLAAKEVA
jgi:hypothetical protein